MKVAFHTLGCKVNMYETETIKKLFIEDGYEIVDFDEHADVYLINTCSVTNIADKKSRQMIHRARKMNPDARIIVTGCYIQDMSEDKKAELGADEYIDNTAKKELLKKAEEISEDIRRSIKGSRVRADVKISDGCNEFCAYCIIPYRRGRIENREIDSILKEVQGLAAIGHKEIVLTGIHITSFGSERIVELIRKIADIEGISRIRLGSLEPRIITEEFLRELKYVDKFCPHFHLSLQSGCDKTLKAMNRHYTADEYRSKVRLIRQTWEHPAITTDIIAGFPGETDEDFEESLKFADEMKFYHIHAFPYSRREGTRADRMPDQLTQNVKAERVRRLEEIDAINSREFEDYYLGKTVKVLTEDTEIIDGKEYMTAHTDTFVKGYLPGGTAVSNTLVDCTVFRKKEGLSNVLFLDRIL